MSKLSFLLSRLEERTKNIPAFLVFLLIALLIFRLPSLFEPFWYGDEGIYLTLGQSVRQGQTLYRDIHDNKPPLLYWLSALAGSVFWLRFILSIWLMGTTVIFFKLTKKIFSQSRLVLSLTTVFVLLTSLPILEGTTTNAEHFFIGLTILGVYFFLEKKLWLSGLMLGLGFLFKSPPLFDWSALLAFLFLTVSFTKKDLVNQVKTKLPLVLGFLIPTVLTFVFYSLKAGSLLFYFESVWQQNFPYLSSWGGSEGTGLFGKSLFWRGIILLILLIVFFIRRKLLSKKPVFFLILLWSIFALFGALLSSRPYPHYLLQVVAPMILLGGFLVQLTVKKTKKEFLILGMTPIIILIIAFFHYGFYVHKVGAYYQNFAQFVLKKKSRADYFNWFDHDTWRNYQLVDFINDSLPWDKEIFIWGNEPNIYALSRRLPVGRYTVAYHILDFDRCQEVSLAIKTNPPKMIVYDLDFEYPFPELLAFLASDYQPIEQFGSLQVWYHFGEAF